MARDEFMKPDVLSGVLLLVIFAVMFFFFVLTGVFSFFAGMH
jgi:hypothetical protein